MRVSSSAPSMSRRSIMRGIAAALVGASIPVAAIAGITARKLTAGNDAELLRRCREWHKRTREVNRMGKELARLIDEAQSREPPTPLELYEDVQFNSHFPVSPSNGAFVNGPYSWTRQELVRMADGNYPMPDGELKASGECQAHSWKLLALLDRHELTVKKVWTPHDRFEKQWEREVTKQWRSFLRIVRTKAETLQGVAVQFEVIEHYWYPIHSSSPKVDAAMVKLMANVRRLVAAQSAGV